MWLKYPPGGWSVADDTRFGRVDLQELLAELKLLDLSVDVDSVATTGDRLFVRLEGNPTEGDTDSLTAAFRAHGSEKGPPVPVPVPRPGKNQ